MDEIETKLHFFTEECDNIQVGRWTVQRHLYSYRENVDALLDHTPYVYRNIIFFQGIQLLVDTYNGFGGLASSLLDLITDDYCIKGLMTQGYNPPHLRPSVSYLQILNFYIDFYRGTIFKRLKKFMNFINTHAGFHDNNELY